LQLAQGAGLEQILAELEVGAIAALAAGLVDAVVAAEGIGQRPALLDGHGAGLLAVHILAVLCSKDGERSVPAVAGGNQHGIDVRTGEQRVVIVVHLAVVVTILLVDHRLDCFAPFIADVADRDESRLAEVEQFAEVVFPAGADADAAENNLVAGRNGPRALAEHHAAGDDGCEGAFENLATGSHGSVNTDFIPI
jgi:hypothetical protein